MGTICFRVKLPVYVRLGIEPPVCLRLGIEHSCVVGQPLKKPHLEGSETLCSSVPAGVELGSACPTVPTSAHTSGYSCLVSPASNPGTHTNCWVLQPSPSQPISRPKSGAHHQLLQPGGSDPEEAQPGLLPAPVLACTGGCLGRTLFH